jgi:hypothetical protein
MELASTMAVSSGLESFLAKPVGQAPAGQASAETVESSNATTAPAAEGSQAVSTEPTDFDPNDPAEKTPEQRAGLRKALDAERKKRQEHERLTAELRGQLQAYQQLQQKPQAQQPSEVNDFDQLLESPPKYVGSVVDKRIGEVDKTIQAVRLELSEELARSQHQDFDEVITAFEEASAADPTLLAKFQAQAKFDPKAKRNPAKFAYDYAKTYREVSAVGSLDELRAKIEADLRPKLEAELRKKGVLAAAEQASTSSAGARGSGNTSPVVSGDRPIGEILRDR